MALGIHHIEKQDFPQSIPKSSYGSLQIRDIRNGFAATGLQPERFLLQLTKPTNWVPETPHNIVELQHQAATIKAVLKQRTQNTPSPADVDLMSGRVGLGGPSKKPNPRGFWVKK
jgi:hypothetical protein